MGIAGAIGEADEGDALVFPNSPGNHQDSAMKRANKSNRWLHFSIWVFIIGLPLGYCLSVGPAMYLFAKVIPPTSDEQADAILSIEFPKPMAEVYGPPMIWCVKNSGRNKAADWYMNYMDWWADQAVRASSAKRL